MQVTVLVPAIHDRPTGGNIYNRRVTTVLQHRVPVDVVPWEPEVESPPSMDVPRDAALVVDSLLVREEAPLRALRAANPTATLVLLAHYLHCIDPNEQDAPAAVAERAVLPLFDGAVTTSRYARQALADEGVAESRIAVVPPGLDEAYRVPVPERAPRATPRLLTVANLLPGKGLPVLIETLGRLPDLAWTWTLVGDDTLAPNFADTLHDRIRDAALTDRVTRTGAVPATDLRAHYDRADVFVLPSRFETCSMATREAMARGLPIVGCQVGGLPENVGAATTSGAAPAGRLVPPNRPDALADALRSLLTDPAARARRGRAARKRSRSFPTWDAAAARLHSALHALHGTDD